MFVFRGKVLIEDIDSFKFVFDLQH